MRSQYKQPSPQGICEFSGFKVPLNKMVKNWDGARVDRRFVDKGQHPQDFVRGVPDNQALPYSRPESADQFISSPVLPSDL